MELQVGQRIDIFKVVDHPYHDSVFKKGGLYAEVAGNAYHGNKYGRDMIYDGIKYSFPIHLNTTEMPGGYMVKVGTMIIKSVKKNPAPPK